MILIICLSSLSAHAQHFDWVRTYTGPEFSNGYAANEIYGSVMDIGGNVYILGHFIGGANWDDNSDIIPLSSVHRNRSAVVAKFSPDGEIVWHKEFYSSYTDFNVFTIRMVGDTALMLYAEFRFPFNSGTSKNEVYYLDTLLTNSERFPESPDTLKSPNLHYAFITIGTESGNLIEEHFLIPSYVKNDGSLLRDKYTGYLTTYFGKRTAVNVDSEGNIILVRETADIYPEPCDTCPDGYYYWSPTYGNISTMRLLIDGATKQLDVPLEPSSTWNRHIIKLSPHLDSVIASTYVFDSTWRYHYNENISMYLNSIDVDESDNIYVLLRRKQDPVDSWPVKNSDTLAMEWYQCMIRYNSSLTPTGITQVIASYAPSGHAAGGLEMVSTYYDTTTNSLFLQGFSGRHPEYTALDFDGDTLNLMNNACWLRLDADDLSLISYGKARSTGRESYERTYLYTDKYLWSHNGSFVAGNNRVFCQVKYQCNILFNDTQINSPYGMGLFVWDYDGHELEYIDYNSNGMSNQQSHIHLKDSSLWLSGTLTANADFGDFHINAAYNSHAYIAHYTDTAFMTPYVYDTTNHGGGEVRITVVGDEGAFVAYPNPFRQSVKIRVESGALKVENGVATAWLTDLTGRREEVRLTPDGPGQYSLDLTSRPQATYLLTLTTADGKQHTVRLLKQSDIFTR